MIYQVTTKLIYKPSKSSSPKRSSKSNQKMSRRKKRRLRQIWTRLSNSCRQELTRKRTRLLIAICQVVRKMMGRDSSILLARRKTMLQTFLAWRILIRVPLSLKLPKELIKVASCFLLVTRSRWQKMKMITSLKHSNISQLIIHPWSCRRKNPPRPRSPQRSRASSVAARSSRRVGNGPGRVGEPLELGLAHLRQQVLIQFQLL